MKNEEFLQMALNIAIEQRNAALNANIEMNVQIISLKNEIEQLLSKEKSPENKEK